MAVSLTNGEVDDRPLEVLFSDEGLGDLTYTAVSPDGSDLWVSYRVDDAPLPVLVRQPLTR